MNFYLILIVLEVKCIASGIAELVRERGVFLKDLPPPSSSEGRITNGFPRNPGDVPFIVGLQFQKNSGYWWCGGSIISQTWVLTAAHCTGDASSATIYYGATQRLQPQYTHTVSKSDFIQHSSYNAQRILNDVSLIRTPSVEYTKYVKRIELPRIANRQDTYADQWVRVSGWGKTSDSSGIADRLNSVDLRLMSNRQCSRYFRIGDSVLCAYTPQGKSSCNGDSGGPVVLRNSNRLVGVVSFGALAGCTKGYPAGFARVTVFLDWIKSHTGIAY